MIDFSKQLEKLELFQLDQQFIDTQNETALLFKMFTDSNIKLNKTLGSVSTSVDEIFSVIEDDSNAAEQLTTELSTVKRKFENKTGAFVSAIISIADMIEDLLTHAEKSDNEILKQQARIMDSNTAAIMSGLNIIRVGVQDRIFNPHLQTIAEVDSNSQSPKGTVLSVIRSGYMFDNKIIRKASVIVGGNG